MFVADRRLLAVAAMAMIGTTGVACGAADRATKSSSRLVATTTTTPAPAPAAAVTVHTAGEQQLASTTSSRSGGSGSTGGQWAGIETAARDHDLCGVYEGLTHLRMNGSSRVAVIAQLSKIHAVMEQAAPLVSASLAADWATMIDTATKVADALQKDPKDSAAAARRFDDGEYIAAQRRVEAWMDDNCA